MKFAIAFEKIKEPGFPADYYYGHIPSLGLTTHGLGVEGARAAATDLVRLWCAEKRANGEPIPADGDVLFSTLEIPDDALQSA